MAIKAIFRLSLTLAVVGGGLVAGATAGAAAADQQLIWSANSSLVNQSTEALRDGRHAHAVRFARDVLRSKTHASNHLIARHNLCLAYTAQGKTEDAKPLCDLAMSAAAGYRIADRDGRLTVSTEDAADAGSPTLEAAVRANIARVNGGALAENR